MYTPNAYSLKRPVFIHLVCTFFETGFNFSSKAIKLMLFLDTLTLDKAWVILGCYLLCASVLFLINKGS